MGRGARLSKENAPEVESSHHCGYVIKGPMIMHRPEGDIVVEAGEAYNVAPGRTGEVGLPGTEVVEVGPVDEHEKTMAVMAKNHEAAASD